MIQMVKVAKGVPPRRRPVLSGRRGKFAGRAAFLAGTLMFSGCGISVGPRANSVADQQRINAESKSCFGFGWAIEKDKRLAASSAVGMAALDYIKRCNLQPDEVKISGQTTQKHKDIPLCDYMVEQLPSGEYVAAVLTCPK
jgi:hypothetical protein